jgi:hypothetical protein
MKKLFLLVALFIASVSGYSILPPLAEGIREISQIICHEEFSKNLGSENSIRTIEKNDQGYLITTNRCTMQVDVTYLVTELIGPQHFILEFHTPIELPNPEKSDKSLEDSIKEIGQIVCHCEFYKALGSGDLIEKIEKTEKGYLVTTNYRTLQVDVIYLNPELIGEKQFNLKFKVSEKFHILPIDDTVHILPVVDPIQATLSVEPIVILQPTEDPVPVTLPAEDPVVVIDPVPVTLPAEPVVIVDPVTLPEEPVVVVDPVPVTLPAEPVVIVDPGMIVDPIVTVDPVTLPEEPVLILHPVEDPVPVVQ